MAEQRFKTGETCSETGDYRFDGYTDGTLTPSPTPEERLIPLSKGATFPPIKSSDKGCYWVKI
jgi:YjzC-like protein